MSVCASGREARSRPNRSQQLWREWPCEGLGLRVRGRRETSGRARGLYIESSQWPGAGVGVVVVVMAAAEKGDTEGPAVVGELFIYTSALPPSPFPHSPLAWYSTDDEVTSTQYS